MPLRKKSAPRRRPLRRRPLRRRGLMAKRKGNVGEFASLSCSRTLTIVPPNPNATLVNTMYNYNNFALADFPRAAVVAQGYQHYRITGVKLTFKPVIDTFAGGGPGAFQKMNFYYMIDKSDGIPTNVTLEGLKQMGARPRSYDERPVSISWRPSVLNDAEVGLAGQPAQYKVSPWLTTNAAPGGPAWNPSTVAHKGVKWYVEAPGVAPNAQTVYVEVELQFQFKKPLVVSVPGAPQAKTMEYPAIDASPDGVEGGTDGITLPIVN